MRGELERRDALCFFCQGMAFFFSPPFVILDSGIVKKSSYMYTIYMKIVIPLKKNDILKPTSRYQRPYCYILNKSENATHIF